MPDKHHLVPVEDFKDRAIVVPTDIDDSQVLDLNNDRQGDSLPFQALSSLPRQPVFQVILVIS